MHDLGKRPDRLLKYLLVLKCLATTYMLYVIIDQHGIEHGVLHIAAVILLAGLVNDLGDYLKRR